MREGITSPCPVDPPLWDRTDAVPLVPCPDIATLPWGESMSRPPVPSPEQNSTAAGRDVCQQSSVCTNVISDKACTFAGRQKMVSWLRTGKPGVRVRWHETLEGSTARRHGHTEHKLRSGSRSADGSVAQKPALTPDRLPAITARCINTLPQT